VYQHCTSCSAALRGDGTRDSRYHCLNCVRMAPERTRRHDAVRDAVFKSLQRIFGTNAAQLEPVLPSASRGDIRLMTGETVHILDVSVVNPACDKHIAAGSDTSGSRAADAKARAKRLKYQRELTAMGLQPNALVPFVVEATGRLGTDAEDFITKLATLGGARDTVDITSTVKFLKDRIRSCVLRHNGIMAAKGQALVRPLRATA
jgi:hypothetical protein